MSCEGKNGQVSLHALDRLAQALALHRLHGLLYLERSDPNRVHGGDIPQTVSVAVNWLVQDTSRVLARVRDHAHDVRRGRVGRSSTARRLRQQQHQRLGHAREERHQLLQMIVRARVNEELSKTTVLDQRVQARSASRGRGTYLGRYDRQQLVLES